MMILTLLVCGASLVPAQTPPPGNSDAASALAAKPPPPNPQYVFVPYDKETGPKLDLKQSVLLPYAEFLRLKKIVDGKTTTPDFRPIASIVQSSYKGTAGKNVTGIQSMAFQGRLVR